MRARHIARVPSRSKRAATAASAAHRPCRSCTNTPPPCAARSYVPDPKLFAAAATVSDLLSNGSTASPERPRATVGAHAEASAAVADSGAPWRVAVDAAMCAEIEALAGGVGIYSSGARAQAMCGGGLGVAMRPMQPACALGRVGAQDALGWDVTGSDGMGWAPLRRNGQNIARVGACVCLLQHAALDARAVRHSAALTRTTCGTLHPDAPRERLGRTLPSGHLCGVCHVTVAQRLAVQAAHRRGWRCGA